MLRTLPALRASDTFAGWIDLRDPAEWRLPARAATGAAETASIAVPGLAFAWRGEAVSIAAADGGFCLAVGAPRFDDPEATATSRRDGAAAAWLGLFGRHAEKAWAKVHEDFAVVLCDAAGARVLGSVDRFGRHALCYRLDDGILRVASRADELPGAPPEVDRQAIFNYVYHHVIPAPRTIFAGVRRLEAAHRFVASRERVMLERYWQPVFAPRALPFEERRSAFLAALEAAVAQQLRGGDTGCYLSGGTDSSTVAGVATRLLGEPAKTFSIGFDATGYDEMGYARIAAERFGTAHHEYYVTPDDVLAEVPTVAAYYDQPFGNSSVVPAYLCARLARRHGVTRMLAGDGGDELFGGNSRYREERLFSAYAAVPRALRRGLLEPACVRLGERRLVAGARKLVRFVNVAQMPVPDRLQRFNLLDVLGAPTILSPALLAAVDPGEPIASQRATFDATPADADGLDRVLAYEWKYVLADNDLQKVAWSARLAGVRAAFPLLDDRIVDLSLELPASLKVRGTRLRHFFKEALRGFLPPEIIAKKKHGFGMPFGVWLRGSSRLKALASGSLESLRDRGVVAPGLLDAVGDERRAEHASYYGELVWVLMVLEHWLQARVPSLRLA